MANNNGTIQLPGSIPPHASFKNSLWITMQPFEVDHQTVYSARGGRIKKTGKKGPTYKLLAPSAIQETIAHSWEEYESMMTRLAGKIKDIAKLKAEASGLQGIKFTDIAKDIASASTGGNIGKIAGSTEEQLGKMLGQGGESKIPKVKVDSPLIYTNSSRRQYMFTFLLTSEKKDAPGQDIFDVIRALEGYSCPDIKGTSLTEIELPWVFEVKSYPGNLIYLKNAALESVQPTYQEPYVNGYPVNAELTLSFKDMRPLYRSILRNSKGIIRVK